MRFLEEKVVNKPRKDWICEKCGIELPAGQPLWQEKYVNKGKIITNRYCLDKKCDPPNDVRLNIKRFIAFVLVSALIYGVLQYAV
jgi:hypothetical protein